MDKRFVCRNRQLVIYDRDLPNMASHTDQSECGYSVYKGVLVQWDEDQDDRVLDFIDSLNASVLRNLAVVQEHEGVIAFRWVDHIPQGFNEGESVEVEGDSWTIVESECF